MTENTEKLRIQARIGLLKKRDPDANANIIRKLQRKLVKLDND